MEKGSKRQIVYIGLIAFVFVVYTLKLASIQLGEVPYKKMAINNARDVYTRRNEGVSIWVVLANQIIASSPHDKEELFEPANTKVYRHPTFFPIPEEVKNL